MTGAMMILVVLVLLQAKHMLADFYWQTARMLCDRDRYVHPGRALHAAIHAVATVPVFLVVGAAPMFVLVIVLLEFIVHYHIDYWKGWHTAKHDLTPADPKFWQAMGMDQALHQLTYIAMVWAWISWSA